MFAGIASSEYVLLLHCYVSDKIGKYVACFSGVGETLSSRRRLHWSGKCLPSEPTGG